MKRFGQYLVLFVLLGLIVTGVTQAQYIRDTIKLRGYQPSTQVAKLASDTTMTDKARRIFYVNKPDIAARTDFRTHCGSNREQTIVLGCYHGNQNGIYLLDVTDQRLAGVEQVTAAHEMLHAAYDRLSSRQKADINKQLEDFYATVKDERIIKTIDAYRVSEPNDVVNEMHSIFGTEIASLPDNLENYYRQYFTNRSAITTVAADYENEFSSRRQQVDAADQALTNLKKQIDNQQSKLVGESDEIQSERQKLNAYRTSGNNAAYNAAVPGYNAKVDTYNDDLATLRRLINQYNQQVQERNAIAEQIDTLVDAISSNDVPSEQQ